MKFSVNSLCPCGSKKKYKKCCQIYHKGAKAKDSLTLMKSRYTAFAIQNIKYIISTSTFQTDFDDLTKFSNECDFINLEILDYSINTVTFKATIVCNGIDNSFTEKSHFVQIENNWYYDSGEILS